MQIDIGIGADDRKVIADELSKLLADSYTLYIKTHNFHWNVTGPLFQTLHEKFEEQYTELAEAVDVVAERIRALGHPAPGSASAFARLATVKETDGVPSAKDMIKILVEGHEAVVRTSRSVAEVSEKGGDEATADLAVQRLRVHEKEAWMLRSLLEEPSMTA